MLHVIGEMLAGVVDLAARVAISQLVLEDEAHKMPMKTLKVDSLVARQWGEARQPLCGAEKTCFLLKSDLPQLLVVTLVVVY